jgi:hypothetical protein
VGSPDVRTVRQAVAGILEAADLLELDQAAPEILALRVLLSRWLMDDPESITVTERLVKLAVTMMTVTKDLEPDPTPLGYRATLVKTFVTGYLVGRQDKR